MICMIKIKRQVKVIFIKVKFEVSLRDFIFQGGGSYLRQADVSIVILDKFQKSYF